MRNSWTFIVVLVAFLAVAMILEPPIDPVAIQIAAMTAAVPTKTATATATPITVEALATRVAELEATAFAQAGATSRLERSYRRLAHDADQIEGRQQLLERWAEGLEQWLYQVVQSWLAAPPIPILP